MQGWLQKNYVYLPTQPEKSITKLNKRQARELLKGLCPIRDATLLPEKKKQDLIQQVLGDDKTDLAEEVRIYCQAASPDELAKKRAWAQILNQGQ